MVWLHLVVGMVGVALGAWVLSAPELLQRSPASIPVRRLVGAMMLATGVMQLALVVVAAS